ncbi:MAG TPA: ABC transporter permease [Noviherbaspirillum sp.]|jgi:ABC-type transport system involved in multi-copper enzyme maturation permease subunit|uniref:ABC transporter permease n=1 Tax=Noviherbaspirillum sp. TaxID=1926288 RepID=UPI002DDCE728|nr:ABC transporter permease [Noviherbaspirillum sp.]HEV2611816.1 ABC transporter permease [Noviherbaspirillum sp.]
MLQQIHTIARYTLLEALRNRLVWLFFAVAVAGIGLSGFLNELAIAESRQVQVAILAAFARFASVFLLATFIVTSMIREFNDKGLELILALPLPRAGYYFGKLAGFGMLALLPAALFGGLMLFFAPGVQAALWTLSLLCELWLIAAFSLLCVITFNQVMTALSAVMAFYLMARSVAALQLIGHASGSGSASQGVINMVMDGIAMLLPHLDRFTRTEWLVYHTGAWSDFPGLLAQTAIFLSLAAGAALFDLYRRNI